VRVGAQGKLVRGRRGGVAAGPNAKPRAPVTDVVDIENDCGTRKALSDKVFEVML
jgi:hypothetical protein